MARTYQAVLAVGLILSGACARSSSPARNAAIDPDTRADAAPRDDSGAPRPAGETGIDGDSGNSDVDSSNDGPGDERPANSSANDAEPELSDEECAALMDEAEASGGDTHAIGARCGWWDEKRPGSGDPPPPPRPIAENPKYERIDWGSAEAWWPFRPLLRAQIAPVGTTEVVFAESPVGGRAANPRTDEAYVLVIYETAVANAENSTSFVIASRGGSVLFAVSPKKVDELGEGLAEDEPIRVRNEAGAMDRMEGPDGTSVRLTTWPGPDGTYWVLFNSAHVMTDQQTIDWLNALVEA